MQSTSALRRPIHRQGTAKQYLSKQEATVPRLRGEKEMCSFSSCVILAQTAEGDFHLKGAFLQKKGT